MISRLIPMKQHVTPEQLSDLSEHGKARLREWWRPKHCDLYWPSGSNGSGTRDYPLLSIGQMIEFLEQMFEEGKDIRHYHHGIGFKNIVWDNKEDLRDALWNACVEVLNKE